MLIFSMSVSVDGFIADRRGAFDWGAPSDELFGFTSRRYTRTFGSRVIFERYGRVRDDSA